MNQDFIKTQILVLADPKNVSFQKRVTKTNYEICGVRIPELRKLAKKLREENLILPENPLYEELLLYGFWLAYLKESFLDRLERIRQYLDTIDSWALCDSFCCSFTINIKERDSLSDVLTEFLEEKNPFYQRFALVMFLTHFLKVGKDGKKLKRSKILEIDSLSDQDGFYKKIK